MKCVTTHSKLMGGILILFCVCLFQFIKTYKLLVDGWMDECGRAFGRNVRVTETIQSVVHSERAGDVQYTVVNSLSFMLRSVAYSSFVCSVFNSVYTTRLYHHHRIT